jgi:hypothetical protein
MAGKFAVPWMVSERNPGAFGKRGMKNDERRKVPRKERLCR